MVDSGPDYSVAVVRPTRDEGGFCSWTQPDRGQKARLGFVPGKSPCHATLTETLRVIDAQALADVLGSLGLQQSGGAQHIAIDGKTMRASKYSNGRAGDVLSAFCGD